MRRFLKVVIVVSGLALLVTLAASIALASRMRDGARSPDARQGGQALFHILAVVPASDAERYYARAVEAMTRTARKRGAVLQTLEYDQDNAPSAIARQLRLAAELEPDGVVVSAPLDPLVTEAVDTLSKRGVPVVALETDLPGSARAAFIGTNPYSVGVLAAEAVAEDFPGGAEVALVLSRDYADGSARGATIAAGFVYGARDANGVRLAMTRTAREGPSASEAIVRELLAEHASIDVAVFIGARDSEGAARALIEYDRVGELAIIGFDDDPALLELVHLGVVAASIARSPERSGEVAVEAIMTLAKGGRVSAYIDPGLTVIRRREGER
ncbi:MAG TPA: substrate-binding domain-containing protein [Spirochaetales bacterium]|nr:substrate-binding domain-containing protein [Spirochaetales bacterium]HPG85428.1 substrate-binding domain-containing protein [Spirochaetales bacterium]HPM72389.1 substrate-binding domain-containing protein [Spirochaetales bacterium]